MIVEPEIEVMHLQAEKCLGLLATSRTKRKAWNRFFQRSIQKS